MKFAFFDFDDTIAKGDSIFKLYPFCIKRHPLSFFSFLSIGYAFILYKCKRINNDKLKEYLLFPLNYLKEEDLKQFYQEIIIPSYYPHMVEIVNKHKKEGYHCLLITASSEEYMKYCDLPFDHIMGTKTIKYTNKVIGHNCINKEKVERINQYLKENHFEIDYEQSYAYSDSLVDIPMLNLVKNRIRVNKKDGSLSPFEY